jgi:hypothetical protein
MISTIPTTNTPMSTRRNTSPMIRSVVEPLREEVLLPELYPERG